MVAPLTDRARGLAALCVTVVVSYGVLYYAFPILAPAIINSTGWSAAAVNGAFSAGILTGAAAGVPAGWLIQRHGPRPVMSTGSVIATVAMLGTAAAPSLAWFTAAWILAGIGMAGVLYPPAFAALTGWYDTGRVRALTTLTLVAGVAGVIFAPLSASLVGHLSWRGAYLVLAAMLGAITIPTHVVGLRVPWVSTDSVASEIHQVVTSRPVVASRLFLGLTTAMTLNTFVTYAVLVSLVPLLTGHGLSTTAAAWALGLSGGAQVAGRLLYIPLLHNRGSRCRIIVVLALVTVSTLLLAVLPGPPGVLVATAALTGASRGLVTLLQATLVSDLWTPHHYAALNGVFNAPLTVAAAIAPAAAAALATATGSYPTVFLLLTVVGGLSVFIAAMLPTAGAVVGDLVPQSR